MLNDTKIKQLKPKDKVYRIADSAGLCLEVRTTGSKIWRYRYRYLGKASMLSLGEYPAVTLAHARQQILELKALLAANIDPAMQRANDKRALLTSNENTFRTIAEEYLEEKRKKRGDIYVNRISSKLELDIYPVIGKKPITEVNAADVFEVTKKTLKRVQKKGIAATGEVTAINNQQIIGQVMNYAMATLRAHTNPTLALKGSVERRPVEHARPLTQAEMKVFHSKLAAYKGTDTVKNAIYTMFYTMLRSIEIRRARWEYVDFDEKVWTIPIASRGDLQKGKRNMKKNRIHLVPLSDQVIAILKKQQRVSGSCDLIFPSPYHPVNMMDKATLNRALKYMGFTDLTGHDFRATSSTALNEIGFKSDWVEIQLAHVSGDQTRATYNHAKYMKDRRDMLQWWANCIDEWGKK